jgi:bacteriochlorophyll 4-vinyl reductase
VGSPIQDIDDFWQLTTKPRTADTRLSTVPVVVISRDTLRRLFRELRATLGAAADDLLYRSGSEAGEAFVGTLARWSGSEDPMEIVDHLGDVYSRCGWFAVSSIEVDRESRQARLRLSRSLETYGQEGTQDGPMCHFLRGYFAGFFRALFWSDGIQCTEVACRGGGDSVCEFVLQASTSGVS